jgi:hypothetical protein
VTISVPSANPAVGRTRVRRGDDFMRSSFWAGPSFIVAFSASVLAQTAAPPAPSVQSPSADQLATWRLDMTHKPLPNTTCFTAKYPSTEWQSVPCTVPPLVPYGPVRQPRATRVGNGVDISAAVGGPADNYISEAIGSFDEIVNVTGGGDAFSLQLNSNRFITQACNSAADPLQCKGWQQFVYSNGVSHSAFIQYWLIGYGKSSCPAGWTHLNNGGEDDCFMNSKATPIIPNQPITSLANLSVTGQANADGTDALIFSTGAALYRVSGLPNVLNLRQGWQVAEFNVLGDGNDSQFAFAGQPYIVIRISMDSTYLTLPGCDGIGFTGETNNLSLVAPPNSPAPGRLPAVVFAQAAGPPVLLICTSSRAIGARNGLVIWPPLPGVFEFGFPQGGPVPTYAETTKLSAVSIPVSYEIKGLPSWITASSTSGTVNTSGQVITLSLNDGVKNFPQGKYPATFEINNKTNGIGSVKGNLLLAVGPPLPHP